MDCPTRATRELARRLLASGSAASRPRKPDDADLIARLGPEIFKFAGADGMAALMRRALALARREVPALRDVELDAEGRLSGLELLLASPLTRAQGNDGAAAITAHLIGLLITFIGESLTMTLLRAARPDATPIEGGTESGTPQ